MTRRQLLVWLGGAIVATLAVTDLVRRVVGRDGDGALRVEVGGPGGPVLRVVPLERERIGGAPHLAG